MTFAADKYCAEFGTEASGAVKLFAEDYSISRTAETGETSLLNGEVSLYNGGAKAVRIKLNGASEAPCADVLDRLMTNRTKITVTYAGMVFEDVVLIGYKCEGKSGCSEKVCVEFAGEADVAESGGTETEDSP